MKVKVGKVAKLVRIFVIDVEVVEAKSQINFKDNKL